ncbi:MAG: substrate-binding domain-containing protein [Alphaproteobacteria bacterium]
MNIYKNFFLSLVIKTIQVIFLSHLIFASPVLASSRDYLLLQTTSSLEDSGLLAYILPQFTKETGIKVKAVSLGSGLALAAAARGEADIAITHSPKLEKQYEDKGFFSKRKQLFWNDFIVVGPPHLTTTFNKSKNVKAVFRHIAKQQLLFFSRGDNSGTHNKEIEIWQKINKQPKKFKKSWYKELGQPMGKTLQSAIAVNAITLCDRATFLKSNHRDYVILFKDLSVNNNKPNKILKNNYSIILINDKKFLNINSIRAKKFFDWMYQKNNTGRGQILASNYRINNQQVFFQYKK